MIQSQVLDKNAERRRHLRQETRQSAEVFLGATQGNHVCMVLDRSQSGLQIDLGEKIELPETMIIQFSGEASQLVRRCWAAGTRAGMEFVGSPIHTGPDPSGDLKKRILETSHHDTVAAQVAAALQEIELKIREFLDAGTFEDVVFFSEMGTRPGSGYRHKVTVIAPRADAAARQIEAAINKVVLSAPLRRSAGS